MSVDAAPRHLFVYGTLRAGGGSPLADEVARATRLVGPASTAGRLYDLGPYPGALLGAEAPDDRVFGDLLEVVLEGEAWAVVLDALDVYEGCHPADGSPPLFRRVEVDVRLEVGACPVLRAWTWVYARDVGDARTLAGGRWTPREA